MVRSNVESKSNLPLFEVSSSSDYPEFLIVCCPREDCPSRGQRPFLVHERTWRRPRKEKHGEKVTVIYGRCCPYCHKVGRIPRKTRRQV
jgi:hypothetical protein